MFTSRVFGALAIAMFVGAVGCGGEDLAAGPVDADPSLLAPGKPPDDDDGIVSGNGALILTPELLNLYAPVGALLAQTNLSVATLEVNDLITTLAGRTFLHYVVTCALPDGEAIVTNVLGQEHTFRGRVGLAPQWTTSPLTTSGKRWMTACLLAHVNLTTASVPILLTGNHPAFGGASSEGGNETFTLREGAFYGNLFQLIPSTYACEGEGTLPERACAQQGLLGLSPCGFSVPGDCRSTSGSVCGGDVDGAFVNCHSAPILPLLPSTNYPETITVYLQE
jgi:hypothetical protein